MAERTSAPNPSVAGNQLSAAEVLLKTVLACGSDYLFVNLGTDHTPIIEAVAKFDQLGWARPKVVLCPHESVALSMAHGFSMISGRAQTVLVHVDVGTQHMGGSVHNIARSRVPVVILAGLAPVTESASVAGSRDMFVHYIQDMSDQAGIVRPYVKLELEMRHTAGVEAAIERAFQVANSSPGGPVYLSVARELLEQPCQLREGHKRIIASKRPAVPDRAALETISEWLIEAKFPIAITSYSGRRPDSVNALVALAETLAMPVMESAPHVAMNFPTDHPLFAGPRDSDLLQKADVVLLLDCDVPWLPALEQPAPGARIIQLDIDPVKSQLPLWTFPIDLSAAVEVSETLPELNKLIEPLASGAAAERIAKRHEEVTRHIANRREKWRSELKEPVANAPLTAEWLTASLNAEIPQDAIIIEELVSNAAIGARYLTRTLPATHFASGGSGIGWGLAAAAGAKLANPDKEVVCLLGDGAFLFAPPAAALWVALQYKTPFIAVIYNNRGWSAPERATRMQHPHGFAATRGQFSASFGELMNLAQIASATGCHAERVESAQQLAGAMARAREAVSRGVPAIVDVLITPVSGKPPA